MMSYVPHPVQMHVGESTLTKDLVWCECGRGISLTGKWIYCPGCGKPIDQESYNVACELAIKNGAKLWRDADLVSENVDLRRTVWLILDSIGGVCFISARSQSLLCTETAELISIPILEPPGIELRRGGGL